MLHVLGHMSGGDDQPPKKKRGTRSGHAMEREYKRILEEQGWFVLRSPASKGVCDLIAIRYATQLAGGETLCQVRFYEIKTTARGPFAGFPPRDRDELISAACASGATPVLAWRPLRGEWREYGIDEWPASEGQAA